MSLIYTKVRRTVSMFVVLLISTGKYILSIVGKTADYSWKLVMKSVKVLLREVCREITYTSLTLIFNP